ncbi:hypothetical protein RB601_001969 [Gaeumannomyces tritici]
MQITQIVTLLALALPALADGAVERRYVGGPANAAALAVRAPQFGRRPGESATEFNDRENNPDPPARAGEFLKGLFGGKRNGALKNAGAAAGAQQSGATRGNNAATGDNGRTGRIEATDPAKQAEQDAITARLDAENNPEPPARAGQILSGGRSKGQRRSLEALRID